MLRTRIVKVLKTLSYREREIIKLRYGLGDGYSYTLEEVGHIFKVTRDASGRSKRRPFANCNSQAGVRSWSGSSTDRRFELYLQNRDPDARSVRVASVSAQRNSETICMPDDERFIQEFEVCRWPLAKWRHRDHVKLAYLYLRENAFEGRLKKFATAYARTTQLTKSPTN